MSTNYPLIVGSCFLVALLEGFDIQAAGIAGPLLVSEFSLGPAQAGMVFGLGMAGLVVGAALGGWLADRLGRRVLLAGSVALFGMATLAMVVAPDYGSLLVVRVVIGLGLGAAMVNLISIAVETAPPALRTRTVTMMFCGMPAGGALAALLGGMWMETLGWRFLFVLGGLLPVLIAPLLLWVLPRTDALHAGDAVSARQSLFGGGRAASTVLIWLAFFMTLMILYLMLNWLPLLVVEKGLSPTAGSQAAFWFNAVSIAGALTLGYLVDRFGAIWPVAMAYAGLVLGMSALAVADSVLSVVVAAGTAGFFLLGAQYALYGVVAMYYPPGGRGAGVGAAIAVGRLGSIAGPIAAGQLLALGLGATGVAFAATPVAVVAAVAAVAASKLTTPYPD